LREIREIQEVEEAWIDDGNRRLIARLAPLGSSSGRQPSSESAITRLIQGIYEREPESARRILRLRIHATASQPTEMCLGMVRVAAKRLKSGVLPSEYALEPGCELIEIRGEELGTGDLGAEGDDSLESLRGKAIAAPMELARSLAAGVRPAQARYLSNRPIAAVLVSSDGRLLGWAVNSSSRNKTQHAEVKLIQGYVRKSGPLPVGSKIYTTLKSCKMCAGMIWNAALDPRSLQVFFDQDDPGPKARKTVLGSVEFGPMTPRAALEIKK